MQIEIDYDMINEIVVKDLQEVIHLTLKETFEFCNNDLVDSALKVLEHYMTKNEYDDYIRVLGYKPMNHGDDDGVIKIHSVEENDDGSANVTFDIPSKDVAAFTSQGINYVLLKSIFDNPSDDDLIRWIKRGQEEERIDP